MVKNNLLLVLAHPDDEIFLLPHIMKMRRENANIWCVYLTMSKGKTQAKRESESLYVLQQHGIPMFQVVHIGKMVNAKDGHLAESAPQILTALQNLIVTLGRIDEVYTPIWEGGHQDHDVCFQISKQLCRKYLPEARLWAFPLYQGEALSGKMFKTHEAPQCFNQQVYNLPVQLTDGFITVFSIFRYTSQWRTFVGLGPFIAWNMLIKRKYQLVEIHPSHMFEGRPHEGPLLYERYGRTTYASIVDALKYLELR